MTKSLDKEPAMFIKLHTIAPEHSEELWINVDHIVSIFHHSAFEGSIIFFNTSEDNLPVAETPEQIMTLITPKSNPKTGAVLP
jgi:hypothetical protein